MEVFELKQTISRFVSAFITAVKIAKRGQFEDPLLEHAPVLPKSHRELLDHLRDMSFDRSSRMRRVQHLECRGMRIVAASSRLFTRIQSS